MSLMRRATIAMAHCRYFSDVKHSAGEAWVMKPISEAEKASPRVEFSVKIPKPIRPKDEPLDVKRARLVWSVRKRGILETDLLLSTFLDKQRLAGFGAVALQQVDDLLEENDWDIYYWTTGAKAPPPEIKDYEFWADLVEHSKNKRKTILRMPDL